jgi:hypothetical protein
MRVERFQFLIELFETSKTFPSIVRNWQTAECSVLKNTKTAIHNTIQVT